MQAESAADAAIREEAASITYRVNPRESRFTVQAFAEGLLSAFGHNPKLKANDFAGEMQFHPDHLEASVLQFSVKADSLSVSDDVSEKDRREIERMMKDDVLKVSEYPEIAFKSQSVTAVRIYEGFYRVKISGRLSLHGVIRDHLIDTQVRLVENGLRAEGETTLRQSDYDIKRVSVAGGTLKVKDEVKLSFLIVAEK
ncbi:MAG: YceI family protein [Acidobacteriota bacterium]|nr:YceI family protein [Acidobacteriota bacterium]